MDEASAIDQISMLHLRYFLAVAEEGTVRAASERIGISQPSLSQQVAQLERRLGVRLFDRSSSGMRLSDAGNLLVGSPPAQFKRSMISDNTAYSCRGWEYREASTATRWIALSIGSGLMSASSQLTPHALRSYSGGRSMPRSYEAPLP